MEKDLNFYNFLKAMFRNFLKAMSLGVLAVPIGLHADESSTDKLNIILFISDDHGYADAGCYGNKVVGTPNIDRLTEQSMRFTRAFTGSPTCAPSRALLYTGLMPFRNGCHPNHGSVYSDTKTLPQYLKPFGYRVVLAGKTHIKPFKEFPFEFIPAYLTVPRAPSIPDIYGTDLDIDAIDSLLVDHVTNHSDQPLCLIIALWRPHVVWRWKEYDPAKVGETDHRQ